MTTGEGVLTLVFIIMALLTGALCRSFGRSIGVPYTVVLLVTGLAVGAIRRYWAFDSVAPILGRTIDLIANVDPHLLLFVFLPTLIFQAAYAVEVHLFKRLLTQIAILAVPGLIVASLLSAALLKWILPWDWGWPLALVVGALISATDPVAIVALLKEVSSRKRLETLLEGESLLNDGTAIVLFSLFFSLLLAAVGAGESEGKLGITHFVLEFFWVVLAGIVVGVGIGALALVWMGRIFHDPMAEIAITLASAYLVYFLAEVVLHVSGVVALVSMALMFAGIGRTRLSPEVTEFVHQFWEVMAYLANTLIFLLAGLLIATQLQFEYFQYFGFILLTYIGLLAIRGGTITLLTPILMRTTVGFNRNKAIVLTWGGVRGAIALALAMILVQTESIPLEWREQVLFLCASIVVLTIVINGSTMEWLLRWLKLNRPTPARLATMNRAETKIEQELQAMIPDLEKNDFFKGVNWQAVKHRLGLTQTKSKEELPARVDDLASSSPTQQELAIAYRRRLLETERQHYWQQFKAGQIGRAATRKLIDSVQGALDGEPTIHPRPELLQLWQPPASLRLIKRLPRENAWLFRTAYSQMALGYDIARGFITAQNEISHYLDILAPNSNEAELVRAEVTANITLTIAKIESLQAAFPEVINTLQTNAAIRLLLNTERTVVRRLRDQAILDRTEADKLLLSVEKRMIELQKMPDFSRNSETNDSSKPEG